MPKKTVWHTDIVVNGQGLGLKITPIRGCYHLDLKADVPGKAATKARKRFIKAMESSGKTCSAGKVKAQVEHAVRKTKARWNRWHKEAYD